MNWQTILSIGSSIGIVVFVIAQGFSGRSSGASGAIQIWKERAEGFELALKEAKDENLKNHDDIIRLQKDLEHAKEENASLKAIVENRNPDLIKILDEIKNFMKIVDAKLDQKLERLAAIESKIK